MSTEVIRKSDFKESPGDDLKNIVCGVCFEICTLPVTLPCRHVYCKDCLEATAALTTLTCPACRRRFASFLRRTENIVDQPLWKRIQDNPEIKAQKESPVASVQLARPGEIRKEFEELQNQLRREELEKRRRELELNKAFLIREKMLVAGPSHYSLLGGRTSPTKSNPSVITISSTSSAASNRSSSLSNRYNILKTVAATINRGTELIKQKVQEKIFPGRTKSLDKNFGPKAFTVPPTKTHRAPSRSCSTDSVDSLKEEIRHFKPIRSVPTSPRNVNSILRVPSVRPDTADGVSAVALESPLPAPSALRRSRRSAFLSLSAKQPPRQPARKRKSPAPPPPPAKSKPSLSPRVNGRVTRSSTTTTSSTRPSTRSSSGLDPNLNIVGGAGEKAAWQKLVVEQQSCEWQLEQERKDYEFAKKLQAKLNRATGAVQRDYSLRRTRSLRDATPEPMSEPPVPPKRPRRGQQSVPPPVVAAAAATTTTTTTMAVRRSTRRRN